MKSSAWVETPFPNSNCFKCLNKYKGKLLSYRLRYIIPLWDLCCTIHNSCWKFERKCYFYSFTSRFSALCRDCVDWRRGFNRQLLCFYWTASACCAVMSWVARFMFTRVLWQVLFRHIICLFIISLPPGFWFLLWMFNYSHRDLRNSTHTKIGECLNVPVCVFVFLVTFWMWGRGQHASRSIFGSPGRAVKAR